MITFKPHESLHYIAPHLPAHPTIVEAGAFTGTDTIRIARYFPHAQVHAFEPVPAIYAQLHANTAAYNNIHPYQYALSTMVGTQTFYVSEKPNKPGRATQAGSLHAPKERLQLSPIQFPYTITVDTTTLDAWAQAHQIATVDLLWLDMQGHELAVLHAAPLILHTAKVIFTEVGFVEAYEHQPSAQDITQFLTMQGFTLIGRDFSDQPHTFFGNLLFARI